MGAGAATGLVGISDVHPAAPFWLFMALLLPFLAANGALGTAKGYPGSRQPGGVDGAGLCRGKRTHAGYPGCSDHFGRGRRSPGNAALGRFFQYLYMGNSGSAIIRRLHGPSFSGNEFGLPEDEFK